MRIVPFLMNKKKKNILLIHTDAQVHNWLGVAGNPDVKTPHIDQLAAEGTFFSQASACSGVCVPSRANLMTGRYPISHGVCSNNQQLPPAELTMGNLFSASGYDMGYFGKTHYGRDNDTMEEEGWRERFLVSDYNQYLKEKGVDSAFPKQKLSNPRVKRYWRVGTSPIPAEHYFENVLGDRTCEFVARPRENSFFCFLAAIAPHGPFTPPPPWDTFYDPAKLTLPPRSENELEGKAPATKKWIEQNQKYLNEEELREFLAAMYGLVSLIDDNVGKVVRALKEAGVYDDTLILFTSDHGDFGGNFGIIGKSWAMIDTLHRIPLISSCPGGQGKGRRIDSQVENIDILPTCLEFAGIPQPKKMHGTSFLPAVQGAPFAGKEHVYFYLQNEYSGGRLPQSGIRTKQWKFLQTPEDHCELYDLEKDPHEWKNLAGRPEQAERVSEMKDRLLRWHIDCSGGYFDPGRSAFWEDETLFYDETKFTGERVLNLSGKDRLGTTT